MERFVLLTDSSADLTAQQCIELGAEVMPLSFSIDGKEYFSYPDERELTAEELYATLRNTKAGVSTSQISPGYLEQTFEKYLRNGEDVLYIAFSSGLSGTCASAQNIADELREKYPQRKLIVVDSLCASAGLGLLVQKASAMRRSGLSIEDTAQWLEENKLRVCHWISVDDLGHLYRGGRLSAATATVGTVLGIKPVITIDQHGKLVNVEKVRGKNNVLSALSAHLKDADSLEQVYVVEAGAKEDQQKLMDLIKKNWKGAGISPCTLGPVIGCHTGPGTLAVVFFGTRYQS